MSQLKIALGLCFLCASCFINSVSAQNLVIENARIIVGPGNIIENGSMVVTDGIIAEVSTGQAQSSPPDATLIDGTGMTLVSGYIDNHRHLIGGRSPEAVARFFAEDAETQMLDLLDAGVTTVQSGGDDNQGIQELKRMIDNGEIKGPRIITSYSVPSARMSSETEVRMAVRAAVEAGADSIAEVHYPDVVWPFAPSTQETKNLIAGLDEAQKLGIPFQIHAVSDVSLAATVAMGAQKLIHSVNINWVTDEQAEQVAASGAQVASITGFGSPNFGVFSQDNEPKFRDGNPWPKGIVDAQGVGQEAGYMPVNLRTLYDHGVDVTFATDTRFYAPAAIAHELKTLSLVFSVPDLIQIMGPNSARFIEMGDQIGTLEEGKFADFLVLANNPYDGFWFFLNPVIVVKGGEIMIDERGQPDAGLPIVRYGI